MASLPSRSKVCFYWYHSGSCRKVKEHRFDPLLSGSQGNVQSKPCQYKHSLDSNTPGDVQLSKVPYWDHKKPCGLPLCPWRNATHWVKRRKFKKGVGTLSSEAMITDTKEIQKRDNAAEQAKDTVSPTRGLKHKAADCAPSIPNTASVLHKRHRHKDDPPTLTAPGGDPGPQVQYDDPPTPISTPEADRLPSPSSLTTGDVEANVSVTIVPTTKVLSNTESNAPTCFFWYHDSYSRTVHGRPCPFQHALTLPFPTIVQPSPGYVHRDGVCGREWCAGDSLEEGKENKSKKRKRVRDLEEKQEINHEDDQRKGVKRKGGLLSSQGGGTTRHL